MMVTFRLKPVYLMRILGACPSPRQNLHACPHCPWLAGDHDVVICHVTRHENLTSDPTVLYTAQLRLEGLMP